MVQVDNTDETAVRATKMTTKKNSGKGTTTAKRNKGLKEKTLRQIKVPQAVRFGIEQYASDHNEMILETQNKAILWFLQQKKKKKISKLYYMASGLEPLWSMWVFSHVLRDLQELSMVDEIPETRILFTALVTFLKAEGYLDSDY